MLRIIVLLVFILSLFFSFTHNAFAKDGYFVVTAYYSPLPNQDFYSTGTYEGDIRLNGQGTHGASGRGVFSGMLAAPKSYSFGTNIYLKGLGVGVVEDRGGAIVPAGQRGYRHDRIDIWTGYGDEGLRRANQWGKRTIEGYIVNSSSGIQGLNYRTIPAPMSATHNLIPSSAAKVSKDEEVDTNIHLLDQKSYEYLSLALIELGYNSKSEKIEDMRDTLISFQIDASIIGNKNSYGAGYYGPKTLGALEELLFQSSQEVTNTQEEETIEIVNIGKEIDNEAQKKEEIQKQHFLSPLQEKYIATLKSATEKSKGDMKALESLKYKDIGDSARKIQEVLASFGYFNEETTGYFGVETQAALITYQMERKIIDTINSPGAGKFGPKTKARFKKDLTSNYFYEAINDSHLKGDLLNLFHSTN